MPNKTKIVATIGPASNNKKTLQELILAGMNVARINFSHGSYDEHAKVIKTIRSLSKKLNKPVALLADLQGPKIRTGLLTDGKPVTLKTGGVVKITSKNVPGTEAVIATGYKHLPHDVQKGDTILIDDGLIQLRVLAKNRDTVFCAIVNGGILKEHKGINLPGVRISVPSLTEKDKKDCTFCINAGMDYIALSFVRTVRDILHLKALIANNRADIPVIAKIEKPEAVQNIDSILAIADGVMVARGDLGVEMHPEQVPTIQKLIISKALAANKPVITATQMLESMIYNPVPTRAEASDVANAIFDGTDAIMLSAETATGTYPVQAVQTMAKIAQQAESSPFMKYNLTWGKNPQEIIAHAIAESAVYASHTVDAKAIVVFSQTGKTSRLISRQRPSKPLYCLTPFQGNYNRLSLVWGIHPLLIRSVCDTKKLIGEGEKEIVEKGVVQKDDLIVIVTGLALKSGSTNLIKIHRIGKVD